MRFVSESVVGSAVDDTSGVDVELDVDSGIVVLPPPHTQHACSAVRLWTPTARARSVLQSWCIARNEQLNTVLLKVTDHETPAVKRSVHVGSTGAVELVETVVGKTLGVVTGSAVDDCGAVDDVLDVDLGRTVDVLPPPHTQHASAAV